MALTDSSIIAPVVDGKLNYSTETESTTRSSGSSLGKEDFLQLLVAQMKYQDPLEPMDNTEYVSQLATFSQLEEIQNMESVVESVQATGLLGKQVVIHTTNSSGVMSEIVGYVDYTTMQGNKVYLSIDGSLYSIDDLYQVLDEDYTDAASIAASFSNLMKVLPDVKNLTVGYEDTLKSIRAAYDALSGYQKKFIDADDLTKLEELEAKMEELLAAQKPAESTEGTDGSEAGESTETGE